jgi:hypothetical protein
LTTIKGKKLIISPALHIFIIHVELHDDGDAQSELKVANAELKDAKAELTTAKSAASLMHRFHPDDVAVAQKDHQLPPKK